MGYNGWRIRIDDVIKRLTSGENAKILGRMWQLTALTEREIACAIYDDGEKKIYLDDFTIGTPTSVDVWRVDKKRGKRIGNAHTHPHQHVLRHSPRDVKNMLSAQDAVCAIIGARWEAPLAKIRFCFLPADVMASELYYAYLEGVWWNGDGGGREREFSDEDYKKLLSKLIYEEAQITPVSVPTTYYCKTCKRRHKLTSGVGRWHINREVLESLLKWGEPA
ncbi:MAG: hypothetical protein ACXQS1_05870 [Methermicoccaceae archaeon]